MRPIAILLLICSFVLLQSCSGKTDNTSTPVNGTSTAVSPAPALNASTPGPGSSPAARKVNVDVCSLLTSAEIQAVQGEPLKGTKASEGPSGNFVTTLCYYELPTPSNSVSLSLTQVDPEKAQGQSLKEFWETTFARSERKGEAKREKDRDKEKNKTSSQSEGRETEEEEAAAPALPVSGVGDEAFWSGTRVGGALYVLKGNRFIRISVGGKSDNETKLKKSKTLALKALRRL